MRLKALSPLGRGLGEGENLASLGLIPAFRPQRPLTRRLRLHPLPRGERDVFLHPIALAWAAPGHLARNANGHNLWPLASARPHHLARRPMNTVRPVPGSYNAEAAVAVAAVEALAMYFLSSRLRASM